MFAGEINNTHVFTCAWVWYVFSIHTSICIHILYWRHIHQNVPITINTIKNKSIITKNFRYLKWRVSWTLLIRLFLGGWVFPYHRYNSSVPWVMDRTNLRMTRSVFGGCAAYLRSTGAKVGWTQDTVIGGMDFYQKKKFQSKEVQIIPNLKIWIWYNLNLIMLEIYWIFLPPPPENLMKMFSGGFSLFLYWHSWDVHSDKQGFCSVQPSGKCTT